MQAGVAEDKPSYVMFEYMPIEDREASIAAGIHITKDVAYAYITPSGSKDRIPKVATDWLAHIKREAQQGRFNPAWANSYQAQFDAWLKGEELPLEGTPVKNWAALSPGQVKTLIDLNLRTVEDVARMNDECRNRLGMGGHTMKQLAVEFLAAAEGPGKASARITELEKALLDSNQRNNNLADSVEMLQQQVKALMANTPGPTLTQFSPPAGYEAEVHRDNPAETADVGDIFGKAFDSELADSQT